MHFQAITPFSSPMSSFMEDPLLTSGTRCSPFLVIFLCQRSKLKKLFTFVSKCRK
eukprot:UN18822